MEWLISLIKEYFGLSFLIGLLCVGAFIYLIVWTVKAYYKIKKIDTLPCEKHSDKLDSLVYIASKIEHFPCAEHKEKINEHDSRHSNIQSSISSINTSISYMQKSIDSIAQSLQSNNKIVVDPFTQSHSPLSITPMGYEMMERINGYEMFENNWLRIQYLIDENSESKNPYDIQQFCIEQAVVYPNKFLKDSELDKVKMDAYTTGSSLASYMRVFAVLARDRYFEENNIDVMDVDKYSPKI